MQLGEALLVTVRAENSQPQDLSELNTSFIVAVMSGNLLVRRRAFECIVHPTRAL